jgi:hypothetical protein
MIKLAIFFQFIFLFGIVRSQNIAGTKFSNECEFLLFEKDSLVEYSIYGSIKGALTSRYCGCGIFHLTNSNLIIKTINPGKSYRNSSFNCDSCQIGNSLINKFNLKFLSNGSILLTGPILDNYKKLNRKRQFSGILDWPWRWNFAKQHWYDPRERILSK